MFRSVRSDKLPVTIFRPKAKLRSLEKLGRRWVEGETNVFAFTISTLIPFGKHGIYWERIDPGEREIQTRENGLIVPVWDNRIHVAEGSGYAHAVFHDDLVLRAGWVAWFTALYAEDLFRYRHLNLMEYCERIRIDNVA